MVIVLGEVGVDGDFQVSDALEDAAPDALAGDLGEEPLDQVEPGRRGRREVQVEPRMLRQPRPHGRMLVGGVVVHHQVQIEVGGRVLVDDTQEPDELLMAVPLGADLSELAPGVPEAGPQALGWSPHEGDVWTRSVPSRLGEPHLLLRVSPNPAAGAWVNLWIWEIVDPCDEEQHVEGEIDNGEASNCAEAMEAALAEALAHIARPADE